MFTRIKHLILNVTLLALLISLFTFTVALAFSGESDSTFGNNGEVTTHIVPSSPGRNDRVQGIAIQSNGRIVAAGYSNSDFAVARYASNGTLDTTFSGNGTLITNFGGDDRGYDVALQSDNKVVVAGTTCNNVLATCDVALARYTTAGKLDLAFSGDGKVITNSGGNNNDNGAVTLAIQPDGKIVVAGYAWNGTDFDFAIYRYRVDGILDNSFSGDGVSVGRFGAGRDDFASDLVIQSDGKILVVGTTGTSPNHNFAMVRLHANGTLDTGFGKGGLRITNFGGDDFGNAVAIQPNGKIVVVGEKFNPSINLQSFAVARYDSLGTLDPKFNGTGKKVFSLVPGKDSWAVDVIAQPDGKIVVLGNDDDGFDSFIVALARLNSNGSFDTTFGLNHDGEAEFGLDVLATCLARQPADGKYVIGIVPSFSVDFMLMRVLP